MIIEREQDVTAAALAVMEQTSNPRMRQIMVSLVKHLHGFIRDVRLTEAEFREAAAVIAELGQRSNDTHNEVVLMAGSLGVSSLVCLLNNGDRGQHRDRPLAARAVLAAEFAAHGEWRIDRSIRDTGRAALRRWPRRRQGGPARSRAPRSMSGTPRRSGFTKTRTPNRRT